MKKHMFICNDSVFHLFNYTNFFIFWAVYVNEPGAILFLYFHVFILLHHGLTFQSQMTTNQITAGAKYLLIFQRLKSGFCQHVISKRNDDRVRVELETQEKIWPQMRSLVLEQASIYGNNWSQAEPDSSSSLTQTMLVFFI